MKGIEFLEKYEELMGMWNFLEKENIIKLQHNCRATGFWRERSVEYNFLLLAHEYLFVFQKPL